MSCYFEANDTILWNPSNTVARLFKGQVEAVATAFSVQSGLGDIVDDECKIDTSAFEEFVAEAIRQHDHATHPILRSLIAPVIATALVLVERIGGQPPQTEPDQTAAWNERRYEQAHFMPR